MGFAPDETAGTGAARLGKVAACLSIDLNEQDLIRRLKASATLQALGRMPAVIQYPVAGLQERLTALESWSEHLPQL